MTRAELKDCARQALGDRIFGNVWMLAVLVTLLYGAAEALCGTLIPGFGALLVMGPLGYGYTYVFLKNARDGIEPNPADLFKGFQGDFSNVFLVGLMTAVFTMLWSLLFVIPGIVKAYSYSLVYYLKIDHPDYDWRTCISESRRLMKGHKWEKFVLDLSFIGWFFVGSLCLGVGTLWVQAYAEATSARFYEYVRTSCDVLPESTSF